jgi:hypothetical protein
MRQRISKGCGASSRSKPRLDRLKLLAYREGLAADQEADKVPRLAFEPEDLRLHLASPIVLGAQRRPEILAFMREMSAGRLPFLVREGREGGEASPAPSEHGRIRSAG